MLSVIKKVDSNPDNNVLQIFKIIDPCEMILWESKKYYQRSNVEGFFSQLLEG